MTREEIKTLMNELHGFATPDNQARTSDILTSLTEEFETLYSNAETSTTRINDLTLANETLRDVNAKLFLKVGTTEKEAHKGEITPTETIPENELTFEKLFNEKGELM